jgi:hypothetical protein
MAEQRLFSDPRPVADAVQAAIARQVRLLALIGGALAVAGFIVGFFASAASARGERERLDARIVHLESQLTHLATRCDRAESEQKRTLTALAGLEERRREESQQDRAALAAIMADVRSRALTSLAELEPYAVRRLHVSPQQVTSVVNRFVDEQVQQMTRLLGVQERRLASPAQFSTVAPPRTLAPVPSVADAGPQAPNTAPTATLPSELDESPGAEEIGVAEISALPGAERPTVAAAPQYISPPPRRGLLFFSPKQPGRLDPERVSGSEAIPLPPR